MRPNADLIALGEAHCGDPRGTPAGNAEFTQEQCDVLRQYALLREHFEVQPVLVPTRPSCPGEIPDDYRAQCELVPMPCPVLGQRLVAPGLWKPIVLLPDGKLFVQL